MLTAKNKVTKTTFLFICCFLLSPLIKSQINFWINNHSGTSIITCAKPSLSLSANSNAPQGTINYLWAGPFGTWIGDNFNANVPGIYTVTATNGTISGTQTLMILANTVTPQFVISPTLQYVTCNPATISQVSVTTISPFNNITHSISTPYGGYFVSNQVSYNYLPQGPGTYTCTLRNNTNGCEAKHLFQVISNSGFPGFSAVSVQQYTLGCQSKSLATVSIFSAQTNPIPGGALSYTVVSPNTGPLTMNAGLSQNTVFTFSSPVTFTLVVRDNATFCDTRIPMSIINNTVGPEIVTTPSFAVLDCSSPTLQILANNSSSAFSYSWNTSSSTTINSASVVANANYSLAPSNTLLTTFSLEVRDNHSLCSSQTVVPVYQNIYKPLVSITTGFADTLTCADQTITIVNNSQTGIPFGSAFTSTLPVNSYAWLGPAPQASQSGVFSYNAYTPGIYTLIAQDANNGCSDSGTISIADNRNLPVLNPLPVFCLPAFGGVTILPSIQTSSAGLNYSWTAPGNTTLSLSTSSSIIANAAGDYTLQIFNPEGCTAKNVYSVSECLSVEMQNQAENIYRIFPNPAQNKVYIVSDYIGEKIIEVYSLEGRLIVKTTFDSNSTEISLDNFSKGVYYLLIKQTGSNPITKKLIIE